MSIDRNSEIVKVEAGDGSYFGVGDVVKALVQPELMIRMKVNMITIVEHTTEVSGIDVENGKKATVPAILCNSDVKH